MPRVALLDEEAGARVRGSVGPEAGRALAHRPAMADVIGEFNDVVARSDLPRRLHELVRYRIAQLNGCQRCQAYRMPGAPVTEEDLAAVEGWASNGAFEPLERLALDFAERFSTDPPSVDDALCDALREGLGDDGLVDLAVCVSKYVGTGRLITVLDLDQVCAVPWSTDDAIVAPAG